LPATVTLKVSDKQAKLLAEMEAKGKIHIVFVYRGEKENADRFLDEQKLILSESEDEAQADKNETDDINQDETQENNQEIEEEVEVSDDEAQ